MLSMKRTLRSSTSRTRSKIIFLLAWVELVASANEWGELWHSPSMPTDPFSSISQCKSSSRVSMARCSRVAVYSALSGSKKLASCSVGWSELSLHCASRRRFPTLNIRVRCCRLWIDKWWTKGIPVQISSKPNDEQPSNERRKLLGYIALSSSRNTDHDLRIKREVD